MIKIILLFVKSIKYHFLREFFSEQKAPLLQTAKLFYLPLFVSLSLSLLTSLLLNRFILNLFLSFFLLFGFILGLIVCCKHLTKKEIRENLSIRLEQSSQSNQEFFSALSQIIHTTLFSFLLTVLLLLPAGLIVLSSLSRFSLVILLIEATALVGVIFFLTYFTVSSQLPRPALLDPTTYLEENTTNFPLLFTIFLFLFFSSSFLFLLLKLSFLSLLLFSFLSSFIFTLIIHWMLRRSGLYSRSKQNIFLQKISKKMIFTLEKFQDCHKSFLSHFRNAGTVYIFLLTFLLLFLCRRILKLNITTIFLLTQMVTLLFSYYCFAGFHKYHKNGRRQFLFAGTVFILLIFLFFLSRIKFTLYFSQIPSLSFSKDLILPITNALDSFLSPFQIILESTSLWKILFPVPLFLLFYFLSSFLQFLFNFIENLSFKRLTREISESSQTFIFSENLSLYPVLYHAFCFTILLFLFKIETQFISNLLFSFIKTLQVEEVFKINIFSLENITFFFQFLFYAVLCYALLRLILDFLGAMFSHFVLMPDEIIYVSNTMIQRSIVRIPLSKIDQVSMKQNIVERLLDIGTITLETEESNSSITVNGVTSISEKNRRIMEKIKIDLQKIK